MRSTSSVVVVGNGAAAISIAQSLRAEGYEGAISLVGNEAADLYDRPPLSKQVLTGVWAPQRAALVSPSRFEALQVRDHRGVAATALDLDAHRVHLADGSLLEYDQLVVATGARPRELPYGRLANVFVLRTLEHALGLRKALSRAGTKFVVIGGGFLGLEVAASARLMGAEVTVVEAVPGVPLRDRIGEAAATRLRSLHETHGVRLLTGVSVVGVYGSLDDRLLPFVEPSQQQSQTRAVQMVGLSDGTMLEADMVLLAIGCAPNTEWLDTSGLALDDGVICDEWCAASTDVWAAGDVARWLHRRVGRHIRLEHRSNATEQGQAVARNILGRGEPFEPVPFFWTDHYDAKIQVAGFVTPDAETEIVAGSVHQGSFVQRFYINGAFAGVLAWNAPREMLAHRAALLKSSAQALPNGVRADE